MIMIRGFFSQGQGFTKKILGEASVRKVLVDEDSVMLLRAEAIHLNEILMVDESKC